MYINGVQITGIQPKPIELTQAEYDALPEEQKQNGCYIITDGESEPFTAENVSYDNTDSGLVATDVQAAIDELAEGGGGGGGGHTIVNDSGTSMTQRSDLQFNGVYTSDNSTDNTTEVNIIREMTEAQYSQLTDAEKKGIIVTDASTPSVIGLTGDMVMYDATNTVNDILDMVDFRNVESVTINLTNDFFIIAGITNKTTQDGIHVYFATSSSAAKKIIVYKRENSVTTELYSFS